MKKLKKIVLLGLVGITSIIASDSNDNSQNVESPTKSKTEVSFVQKILMPSLTAFDEPEDVKNIYDESIMFNIVLTSPIGWTAKVCSMPVWVCEKMGWVSQDKAIKIRLRLHSPQIATLLSLEKKLENSNMLGLPAVIFLMPFVSDFLIASLDKAVWGWILTLATPFISAICPFFVLYLYDKFVPQPETPWIRGGLRLVMAILAQIPLILFCLNKKKARENQQQKLVELEKLSVEKKSREGFWLWAKSIWEGAEPLKIRAKKLAKIALADKRSLSKKIGEAVAKYFLAPLIVIYTSLIALSMFLPEDENNNDTSLE